MTVNRFRNETCSVRMSTPFHLYSLKDGDPGNPPLVILHGLFGSGTNWRSIARAFSGDFHVTCLDLRNHGNSAWSETMDYVCMAEDVAETLDREGIRSPVVLGHSMGGKTAMTLAQLGLMPLNSVIIADIAPVPYSHDHDEFIDAMESVELASVSRRVDAEQQLSRDITDPGIRQFLLQNLVRKDGHFLWRINLPAIRRSLPALLGWNLEAVTDTRALFVYGGNSRYMTGSGRAAIGRYYTNAETTAIPGAGHWLHVEQPERFNAVVTAFLR